MSRDTDQLLLIDVEGEDPQITRQLQEQQTKQIAETKARLRALQEMQMTAGYKLYHDYLMNEARAAMCNMERTEGPTDIARSVGAHCALTRAAEFVDDEIKILTEALAQAGT